MSRIVDEPYFTHSAYSALTTGIQVKCPKCHGAGVVTADDDNAYFRCLSCGHQDNPVTGRSTAMMSITSAKTAAGTIGWILKMTAKQHFPVLHVACPYCGATMSGEVHKTAEAFSYMALEIQGGRGPLVRPGTVVFDLIPG